jgi:hypothetical protein
MRNWSKNSEMSLIYCMGAVARAARIDVRATGLIFPDATGTLAPCRGWRCVGRVDVAGRSVPGLGSARRRNLAFGICPSFFATALMFWCHTIPGVRGATATVGRPLQQLRQRAYLGGVVNNTPD